jgi:hypothetical protein
MSDKTRKKKDGHDRNKDHQAMHEAVHEREEAARIMPHSRDHGRVTEHKDVSAGIKSRQGTP